MNRFENVNLTGVVEYRTDRHGTYALVRDEGGYVHHRVLADVMVVAGEPNPSRLEGDVAAGRYPAPAPVFVAGDRVRVEADARTRAGAWLYRFAPNRPQTGGWTVTSADGPMLLVERDDQSAWVHRQYVAVEAPVAA